MDDETEKDKLYLTVWEQDASESFSTLRTVPSGTYMIFDAFVSKLTAEEVQEFKAACNEVPVNCNKPQILERYHGFFQENVGNWRYMPLSFKRLSGNTAARILASPNTPIAQKERVREEGFSVEEWEYVKECYLPTKAMLKTAVEQALLPQFPRVGSRESDNIVYKPQAFPECRIEVIYGDLNAPLQLSFSTHNSRGEALLIFPLMEDVICHGQVVWDQITIQNLPSVQKLIKFASRRFLFLCGNPRSLLI